MKIFPTLDKWPKKARLEDDINIVVCHSMSSLLCKVQYLFQENNLSSFNLQKCRHSSPSKKGTGQQTWKNALKVDLSSLFKVIIHPSISNTIQCPTLDSNLSFSVTYSAEKTNRVMWGITAWLLTIAIRQATVWICK